ncbi:MAG: tetrahydromethanopterin S-methyltransferase subunit H [Candidatus Bathyarchaeia archaeon]
MFKLETEQKIFEISGVKFGGQLGQLPMVLVGNLFYKGMPEVRDHKRGEFDEKSVLKWVEEAEKLSEISGVPHLLDVMAMYPEAMKRYIEFFAEKTEKPLFIDGANPETRVAAVEKARELGIQERIIFNGISPTTSTKEIEALRESHVKAAVLLALNEVDFSPEGRISVLKGQNNGSGLIEMAERACIEKILVDTVVFDVPSIAYAVEAIQLVKKEFGYPAGCSPANATYDWKAVQKQPLKEGFAAYNVSAHALAQFFGANYLIYGPIKQAKNMIPACAMNDAIIAYHAAKKFGVKPLVSNHPLYKIF